MAFKRIILVVFIAWLTYFVLSLFESEVDKDRLENKNVVVTGASSGIGEQLAYWYARNGANVFITARREQLLQKVVTNCKSLGGPSAKFGYIAADMGVEGDREKVIKAAIDFFGDIDQLILNHAQMMDVYVWNGSNEQIQILKDTLNVNVVAYAHLTGLALPSLERTGGAVGVVSSMLGRIPFPYSLEYVTSKFALDGFFSGLRFEFAATKKNVSITYNTVGLTGTDTVLASLDKYVDLLGASPTIKEYLLSPIKPEEAASAIAYATTMRIGDYYYPKSQFIWPQTVLRSMFPQMFEMLDFTPKQYK